MKSLGSFIWGVSLACALAPAPASCQRIPVADNLWPLLAQEDTDGDQKITVHDRATPFEIRDENGAVVRVVTNEYQLSVLLQDLTAANDQHTGTIDMNHLQLNEDIVNRTHRFIKDKFWDALTRRIDAYQIDRVMQDPKTRSKYDYIYVPAADANALKYFQALEKTKNERHHSPPLKVVALPSPDKITGEFVRDLDGEHGILTLALETNADGKISGVPYVVPGGRFNELYGWDSYFIVLGLLQDGRTDLARAMADNLLYEVRYYGKVPNANRTYYLTRSQPPFLTSIIRAVYESSAADTNWLASALKTAMAEYQNVWLGKDRLVKMDPHGLSRYYDTGNGPCPEVEPGHYDEQIQPWLAQAARERQRLAGGSLNAAGNSTAGSRRSLDHEPLTPYRFLNEYLYCNQHSDLTVDGLTLGDFFKHDRAIRESGHDTTHRFDDRTADFVSVDLNSLLYKYETDFADVIEREFSGHLPGISGERADAKFWRPQAAKRKAAMMALMWDERSGYFFDYDFSNRQRSTYISATGLWPLWAKMLDTNNPAERERAKRIAAFACKNLEEFAGLSATAKESVAAAHRLDGRQWDYPFGWAPHQMLAWQGFKNYGLDADAGRLAYRWVYTISKNAHDYNGMVPEKFNVVTGSHDVFVEYGNVGTKFSYIATEGFGWMNASFEMGINYLSPAMLTDLQALKPPPAR
jgi:alpha,alpha-trehalase